MAPSNSDRNLLFGILALQMDFISRDALIAAMHAWVLDKAKPLGQILCNQGLLSGERLQLLNALVEEHLRAHGGDPQHSLAVLSSASSVQRDLQAINDPELHASLGAVGAQTANRDPVGTVDDARQAGPRFRILRPHAKGGLGEISVAEDQELHREVALKEIQERHADDPHSRGRFLLEAEITGGLEHPGIVPVYSLGSYADGRPFYAMRFIRGDNLMEAIQRFHSVAERASDRTTPDPPAETSGRWRSRLQDFHSLAFRQLLGRFVDVCQAVAYAHSRGVLHRDLKPGNVMLGRYGETLVVDWGLAKVAGRAATAAAGDESTLRPPSGSGHAPTQAGSAVGTPEYMSPEQAAGRLDELGPASDVYSLGATLYVLLTGQPPFRRQGDLGETLRQVQRGAFPKPRDVKKEVPPALEAVCLKAMALRPEDRYATTLALAADVEHWLADEPVSTYAEPWAALAWRWLRGHPAQTAAGVVALLAGVVVAGVVAVLSEQGRKAVAKERDEKDRQRQRAVEARDEARSVVELLASEGQLQVLEQQPTLTAEQEKLLKALLAYYQRYVQGEATEEQERVRQARVRGQIGFVQARLGYLEEAVIAYRQAVEALQSVSADFPGFAGCRGDLARSRHNLSIVLEQMGKLTEAEEEYRQALNLKRALLAEFSAEPQYRLDLARSHHNLGGLLARLGKREEGEAELRQALSHFQKLVAEFPTTPEYRISLAASHAQLGNILRGEEARAELDRALHLHQEVLADSPATAATAKCRYWLAIAHHNLACRLQDLREQAKAEEHFRRAVDLRKKLAADYPTVPEYREGLLLTHTALGNTLSELKKWAQAEQEYTQALALAKKLGYKFPTRSKHEVDLGGCLCNLGNLLREKGQPAESLALYGSAVAVLQPIAETKPQYGNALRYLRNTHSGRAMALEQLGRSAEAAKDWQWALDLAEKKDRKFRVALALVMANHGHHLPAIAEAEEWTKDEDVTLNALIDCAHVFAVASVKVKDATLQEQYASRAVSVMERARVAGHFKDPAYVTALKKHASFVPLHPRDDWKKLLAELEASAKPDQP